MKPIVFSRHARGRMRLYDVSSLDVARVLEAPQRIEPSVKGRINALCEVNGRTLRVTYVDEQRQVVIVTVTQLEP